MDCRICKGKLEAFLDLGQQPLANGFLLKEEFENEKFHHLTCARCDSCKMVQLGESPAPSELFHSEYPFMSSTSKMMARHFFEFSEEVLGRFQVQKEPIVVLEIGCNDGTLLSYFNHEGVQCVGVEPVEYLANQAKNRGLEIYSDFFNESLSVGLEKKYGKFDLIIATNVFCHIPDLNSLFSSLIKALSPNGRIFFEDPYWPDILKLGAFDQIYDEHYYLFSATSVKSLAQSFGLSLVSCQKTDVHGGSCRYELAFGGSIEVAESVDELMKQEEEFGVFDLEAYRNFSKKVEHTKEKFSSLLSRLVASHEEICGYGATSKSSVFLNYSHIGENFIQCIYDNSPLKIGKYSPGMH